MRSNQTNANTRETIFSKKRNTIFTNKPAISSYLGNANRQVSSQVQASSSSPDASTIFNVLQSLASFQQTDKASAQGAQGDPTIWYVKGETRQDTTTKLWDEDYKPTVLLALLLKFKTIQ